MRSLIGRSRRSRGSLRSPGSWSPGSWPRAILCAALFAALSTSLAGCVSLPDTSSVTEARGAGAPRANEPIAFQPRGPLLGASQQEVVSGYLTAMLAFPRDPALVREFMTPSAAAGWVPNATLQVYQEASLSQRIGRIHLVVQLLGKIDARGSWSSTLGPAAQLDQPLQLRRVHGQWRIDNPFPGMYVDADYFRSYFHQYSLYFFDPTFAALAPDPVYRRLGAPGPTATSLVRDLLLGPTADTAGVISSAAPPAARLTAPVVVSSAGVADVPLTRDVATLSPELLKSLAAQLAWTLGQDEVGVKLIRIIVDKRPLFVPEHGTVFPVGSAAASARSRGGGFRDSTTRSPSSKVLYALSPTGRLMSLPNNVATPVPEPIGSPRLTSRAVAINPSGTFAALVSKDGTQVEAGALSSTPAEETPTVSTYIDDATDLLTPSWDQFGLLWAVDQRADGAVLEVTTGGRAMSTPKVVNAPGLSGGDVQAFALSRDGMRLAAIVGTGARSHLMISMVQRDAQNQTKVSLVGMVRVANPEFPLSNLRALAWSNPTTVLVLAKDRTSEAQPYQVSIDGSRIQPTTGALPISPVSVAAGAGSGVPPVIGSHGGALYIRTSDNQWTDLTAPMDLFAPAYPS